MVKSIHGFVLSAGLSSRMGRFKQLLPYGKETVVGSVISALKGGGVDRVTVILGHRAEEVEKVLAGQGVRTVVNVDYLSGMFSSVLCAVGQASGEEALMLALGDQPQITSEICRRVVDAFQTSDRGIVIPVFSGRRGHPIVIDLAKYGDEIMRLDGSEGLKPVVRGHPEDTLEIPFEDDSILRDMDTPADYDREIARREERNH